MTAKKHLPIHVVVLLLSGIGTLVAAQSWLRPWSPDVLAVSKLLLLLAVLLLIIKR